MGLLNNHAEGVRPTWKHQLKLSNVHLSMGPELRKKGLLVLPEATVTDDRNDLAPDLVIFNQSYEPLTIIELTTHEQCMPTVEKCGELIERFPELECYVFDYEDDAIYAYDSKAKEWYTSDPEEIRSKCLDFPLPHYLGA